MIVKYEVLKKKMSTRGCIAIVVVVVVLLGAVGVFGSFRIESYQPTSNNPTEVVEQTLVTKPSPTEVRVVSKQLSDKKTTLKCAQFSDMTFYDAKCSLNDDLLRGDHMEFLTTRRMATGQNATSLYPCVRPHTNIDERPVILWVAEIPRMTQNPLECPVKCQLNSKRDAASVNEADAFVVDLARKWEEDKHIYDWKTNPSNKVLIAWNIENLEGRRKSLARSYKGRYLGKDWTPDFWDSFNLSISYPMGSDIPLNYYNWALCRDKATSQAVQSFRNLKASDKVLRAAAFFSSNCQFTAHWRDAVVLFLKKYFPIHSYGRCQHTHDVKDVKWCRGVSSARSVIKACTLSRYPFTIIIENSASLDYVTEKVYEPLGVGSVPVYLGAPNIENFLPTSHSVIKISDFPSLQSLSKYLNCLLDNPDLLQYYIDWDTRVKFKSWEVFSNAYPPLCQACIRIRNKQLNGPRHPSFIDYIIPENVDSQKPLKKCFDIAVRKQEDFHFNKMVAGPISSIDRQEVNAVFFLSPSSVLATIEKAMLLKASLKFESSPSSVASEDDDASSVVMSEEETLKYDIDEQDDDWSIEEEKEDIYASIPEEVRNTTGDDWATAAFRRILATRPTRS